MSRDTPPKNIKQEQPFSNHVNPQLLFSQQQQQRQQQAQQQAPSANSTSSGRPNPMMFIPNTSSSAGSTALTHQYINDTNLPSTAFGDNELAESLNLPLTSFDNFTYSANGTTNPSQDVFFSPSSAQSIQSKQFLLRNQPNNLYAASPQDFSSFSPDFAASPVPQAIPFQRRAGGLTSMSVPTGFQTGAMHGLHGHSALLVGQGNSLTASPGTPGYFGSQARSYSEADSHDPAKNAAMIQKKQKRRESHNQVERRRRDQINDRIQELARLIPEEFMNTPLRSSANPSSPLSASPATHHAPDGTIKPNKGVILRKSVDYIKTLQDACREQQRRTKLLEEELRKRGVDPRMLADVDEEQTSGGFVGLETINGEGEEDEAWFDDTYLGDDSPGMMMD